MNKKKWDWKFIVSTTIAIISTLLAIYFGIDGRKVRAISYQTIDPVSKIYDSKNATSSIQIYTNDTIPIKEDVYLLTGKIWNSGNLSIDTTDVRIPITIAINDSLRIVDYKVTKQKDSEVADFMLSKKSDYELAVDWKYFDQGYGFEYQIIYIGNVAKPDINLGGKIRDISNFKRVEYKPNSKLQKPFSITFLILASLGAVWLIILGTHIRQAGKRDSDKTSIRVGKFELVMGSIGLIYVIFYAIYTFFIANSGFSF